MRGVEDTGEAVLAVRNRERCGFGRLERGELVSPVRKDFETVSPVLHKATHSNDVAAESASRVKNAGDPGIRCTAQRFEDVHSIELPKGRHGCETEPWKGGDARRSCKRCDFEIACVMAVGMVQIE